MLTPEGAENCKAAIGLYQSKDERTDLRPSMVSLFQLQTSTNRQASFDITGFAAGRANLEDPVHKAAYEDVYKRMAAFFKKHL
ncbi:hypothetical protein FRC10_006962 [Ceratobasidium sp. 414]|nr:hypothetical protein FRC10_006962 [Ceratobasidium sp. 414]